MVAVTEFSSENEVAAPENGADLYARWHDIPKERF